MNHVISGIPAVLTSLLFALLLILPVHAQPPAGGRAGGEGGRPRAERPEGGERRGGRAEGAQRRPEGQAEGGRERAARVDLDAVEVKAPGRLMFVGKNAQTEHSGIFTSWRFTRIELPENDYTKGVVAFEIELASLVTPNGRLTNDLKSANYFNVEALPKATVTLHDAVPVEGETNTYDAKADIQIGETTVTVPARFTVDAENPRHVKGEAMVDRTALKVGPINDGTNPRLPAHEVKVTFDAVIPPKVEPPPAPEAPEAPTAPQAPAFGATGDKAPATN